VVSDAQWSQVPSIGLRCVFIPAGIGIIEADQSFKLHRSSGHKLHRRHTRTARPTPRVTATMEYPRRTPSLLLEANQVTSMGMANRQSCPHNHPRSSSTPASRTRTTLSANVASITNRNTAHRDPRHRLALFSGFQGRLTLFLVGGVPEGVRGQDRVSCLQVPTSTLAWFLAAPRRVKDLVSARRKSLRT